jgi:exodeoxyribonuclease V beta subunit
MQNHPLQQVNFTSKGNAYVVEASAGTGKTWTIERLFIKALLEASNSLNPKLTIGIENILVVTFTHDATSELKERIAEQIKATIDQIILIHNQSTYDLDMFGSYLFERKELYIRDITILNRALQNFDWASIYTIHGFCNKILHDYPFECLINPEFELVSDKSDILESLVLNFMRSQIINGFTNNIDIVLSNIERMFESNEHNQTLVQRIAAKIPRDILTIQNGSYELKYTLGLTPSLDKLNSIELDSETLKVAKAEFLAAVIDYVAHNYIVNNFVSYDELIARVADRLLDSASLREQIYHLFPVAFIDEFQDTDKLQWQIFSSIYQLDDDKRGHVVVVGDPKQAIYRFRGADVDTYIKARQQINNSLSLDTNYRAHPNILNFINQLFLASGVLGEGIKYSPSIPHYSEQNPLPTISQIMTVANFRGISKEFYSEEVQLVTINGTTKPLRSEALLRAMTFEILALLNADPSLKGRIAILVTKNREASVVVEYLRRYGIKAIELKLGNIFATSSAHDLYLFLNALSDLTKRKNFIQAITSKLFNFDLTKLSTDNNIDNGQLQTLMEDFSDYQQIWNTKGIISLIYALLTRLFQNNSYSLDNRELANVWQLAELLNSSPANNQIELLFWFKQKITNANNNLAVNIDGSSEELIRLDNDDEQIIVTTQHKAKGLEYDIVFCPYFKNNITLDGANDYNYKRPFFSSYRYNGKFNSAMVMDKIIGNHIVNNDNSESQRLNYVALTRAKMRLYIYLKQPTTKNGKYDTREKPDKIVELFGYVKDKPDDLSHPLFNYPRFFSNNPLSALKLPLSGVVVYNRNDLTDNDLELIRFVDNEAQTKKTNLIQASVYPVPAFYRQSYTMLTKTDSIWKYSDNDDTETPISDKTIRYRYLILSEKTCSGAAFGTLFHQLCENYPFNQDTLNLVLKEYNIADDCYEEELRQMLDEAFNYPILDNVSISKFVNTMHELEFNLSIKNSITIANDIYRLISEYFGLNHPFTIASKALGIIQSGFLVGFIDLIFEHEGKYWVLDYKTNSLLDYSSTSDINDIDNPLLASIAEHHYYLQYLLYLVAVKRYLEQRLKIPDATNLLGGAVYYYVRGIYSESKETNQGIYIDRNCQNLVRELDELFKRSV